MPLSADERMDRDWKLDQRIDFAIAEALPKLAAVRERLEERQVPGKLLDAVENCRAQLEEVRAQAVRRWD